MRLRFKKWAPELLSKHTDIVKSLADLPDIFEADELEIGFGLGEFIIEKALKYPDKKFLGVEVNYTACASALKKLLEREEKEKKKINNILLVHAPFEAIVDRIKDNSLDCIYLNFNDPWIKKRQHKRRLTYPSKLEIYFRKLKDNGLILYKSDNDAYYFDSKTYFAIKADLFDAQFIDDYAFDVNSDVMSEYERKFRSLNQPIHRIIGRKK